MKTIQQIPFAALGMGAAFTILWGVADPIAAYAEVRMYTGVGKCAMGDLVSPAQAKNYAREIALQNAKEQAGVYLTSYTSTTNTRLSAKEITAITNNITELVGEVKYTQTPTEADGVPVVVYTATLQANVNTDGIKKYLERGEEERITIVSQSEQSQKDIAGSLEKIAQLNEAYNKAQSEEEKEKIRGEFAEADRHLLAEQKNSEGLVLYYKKDYQGALGCFVKSTELDPKYAIPWSNIGSIYGKSSNYDKAMECFLKAIELDSKNSTPWNQMGYYYVILGNPEKGMECFEKAIELNPKDPYSWNNIGHIYGEWGKYETQIEYCKKAAELDKNFSEPWNNMGVAYNKLGNKNKAIECYKKASELNPKDEIVLGNLASIYNDFGKYDEAISYARKAVKISPEYAYGWNTMGFAYFNLANYQEAVECFRKSVRFASENQSYKKNLAIALNSMGVAHYNSGNYQKAVECFQEAVQLCPNVEQYEKNLSVAKAEKT